LFLHLIGDSGVVCWPVLDRHIVDNLGIKINQAFLIQSDVQSLQYWANAPPTLCQF